MAALLVADVAGVPPGVALLTGPILLGNLFGYGLYGILIVQIFVYFNTFPRDPQALKLTVWFVLLVDTIITAFATVAGWNLLASGWGDPSTLTPLNWPFTGLPFLSGLVASVLHFFFAWRIWKLRHSLILPAIICTLSLVSWAMATYSGIATRIVGLPRISELQPFVIVWLGGGTLVDVIITTSMVWILVTAKRSTVFQQSNSKLSRLITITVETGMATALGALSELILFIVFPTNNMHFIPFLMLAKLYSNTLLATLNSRSSVNKHDQGRPALWNDTSAASHSMSLSMSGTTRMPTITPKTGVQISTIVEVQRPSDIEMFVIDKEDRGYHMKPRRDAV